MQSRWTFRILTATCLACFSALAPGQQFPTRPLRVLVPFSVGTPPDILGRIVADRMQLGQPVVVENRPGATGTIALAELLRQPADGHTLLAMPMPVSVAPALYPRLGLDLVRDLEPIGQIAWSYNVLVVHPEIAAKTVHDLVALLKAKPRHFSFASGGNGTPAHLAGELLKQRADVSALHVPYVQFPQAIGDLIAGRVDFMFLAAAPAVPQITAGKIRPLAVTGVQRLATLKEVPTMVEAGYADFIVRDWQGLVVRAGTPPETVIRLNAELNRIVAQAEVRAQLAKMANDPAGGTPAQFGALIALDIERWTRLVQASGIKVD